MLDTTLTRLNGAAPDKTVHENLASDSTGHIAGTLNTALKNKLVHALSNHGYNSLAELLQNMATVDIATNKDVSLRAFVTAQLQHMAGNGETAAKAISELEEQLSDQTTVGELLGLDTPLNSHPVLGGDVQRARLEAVLGASPVLNNDVLDTFIHFYIQHQGTIQDFWNELRNLPEFQVPGVVEAFQFALQLDKLTQGNAPLVQVSQDMGRQMGIASTRDLANLSADDWKKLIETHVHGQPIPIPDAVAGTSREEQVVNYIEQIMDVLRQAFPTAYLAQAIAEQPEIDLNLVNAVRANNPQLDLSRPLPDTINWGSLNADQQTKAKAALEALRQELVAYPAFQYTGPGTGGSFHNPVREAMGQLLTTSPDFDLHTTNIDHHLAQSEKAAEQSSLTGAPALPQSVLADQLKRIQRVFRVTRDPQAIHTLLGAGLHSAHSIASIPQKSFVATFKDALGGETQAKAVHAQASTIHAAASHAYMTIHQNLHDVSPRALGPVQQSTQALLNGAEQSAQAALSPAALSSTQQGTQTALTQASQPAPIIPNWTTLFGAPNLSDCEECHSLYSPTSYFVDLLYFLATSDPAGNVFQKTLFARRPDLQHIKLSCENTDTLIPYIDVVNEILETYIATQTTYDQSITDDPSAPTADELSVNPQHINNTAYSTLQGAVYPLSLPYNRSVQVARTYLGNMGSSYNEVMRTFQNNANPSDVTIACEYLGITPEECAIITDTSATPNPAYYGYPTTSAVPLSDLSIVPNFLQRTSIHYLDLIELVKTRFLNPQRKLTLQDTSGAPDTGDLSKTSLNGLDAPTAAKAHRFIRLWKKLGWQIRDLDRVIAALGATDIDSTFLRKLAQVQQLLTTLPISLTSLLTLWSNIDTYAYETQRDDSLYAALFQNKAVLVDPAFTLNSARTDLANTSQTISGRSAVILAALGISAADLATLTKAGVTNDTLNLANLSMLYRYAVLAKALNLSLSDLIALKILSGINPFMDSNPSLAGLPATTLRFVTTLTQIQQAGFSVAQLSYLYQHMFDPNAGIAPSQNDITLFFQQLSTSLAKAVSDASGLTDPTALVKKTLSSTFKLSMDIVEALVGATPILLTRTTPAASLMQDFLTFARSNPAPSLPPEQLYYLLHKVAMLINTFGLTVKEITHINKQSGGSDFAGFNFNALPPAKGGFTPSLFTQWQRLADLATLRNSLPVGTASLVDVFSAAAAGNNTKAVSQTTMQQLLAATGWNDSEVGVLLGSMPPTSPAGQIGFGLNDTNFRNATWLLTIQACLSLSQRLGVSVAHLFTWATTPSASLQNVAQEIKNAVRAKYDEEQWLAVAKPLTDQLRESQKAALMAYILQMPALQTLIQQQQIPTSTPLTANDLYEIFLIDVDMSASTMTSRIVQGSASVQLFVERVLMGLEPHTTGATISTKVWDWMKRYRTWEANRKIFLYPENYLDPVLRDDKSPFFRDLETQLLQQDITMDSAEDAFLSYLEKLDQVARLEICGMYWEEYQELLQNGKVVEVPVTDPKLDWRNPVTNPSPDFNILHVFGRTFTMPHSYYYRRFTTFVNNNPPSNNPTRWTSSWSAWEKVDLNIEGDHLIPVVYNRRLYLCWPIFTLQAGNQTLPSSGSSGSQPNTYLQIQLAWSEYKQGKWTPRQLSPASLTTSLGISSTNTTSFAKNQYLFKAAFTGSNLDIQVYYTQPSSNPSATPEMIPWTEIGWFRFNGPNVVVNPATTGTIGTFPAPTNSQSSFMGFSEIQGSQLTLVTNDPTSVTTPPTTLAVLNQTSGAYSLLYPHQFNQFTLQAPFFYQDSQRTYFVRPDLAANLTSQIASANSIIPNYNANVALASSAALRAHMPGEAAIFKPSLTVQANVVEPPASQAVLTLPRETTESNGSQARPYMDLQGVDPNATKILSPTIAGPGGGGGGGGGDIPILDVAASPSQVPLGIPQTMTISTSDDGTGDAVAGTVTITNGPQGTTETHPTNAPFTTTFHRIASTNTNPTIRVSATGYTARSVLLTYVPTMTVTVSPAPIPLETPQTITVSAIDADTRQPISGTVIIANGTTSGGTVQESHPTNTAFTTTLHRINGSTPPTAVVTAAGYAQVNLQFNVSNPPPILAVTINPAQILLKTAASITINAVDYYTHTLISGTVTITNGTPGGGTTTETHPTNTAFTTTLYMILGPGNTLTAPTAVISAPGYPSVNVQFAVIVPPIGVVTRFSNHLHPWVPSFIQSLNQAGIDGLLTLQNQFLTDQAGTASNFVQSYKPTSSVEAPYPVEDVNFGYDPQTNTISFDDGYMLYNWELFFHIPLMIATKLSSNQRFEEARRWFHYIFNPSSGGSSVSSYWNTKPFNQITANTTANQLILNLLTQLHSGDPGLAAQVSSWRADPFDPYLIARLRVTPFQKYVVMKYLDNLIAWGDQLFSQDTMESINEATQLYVLAYQILGPRPEKVPARGMVADSSYADLVAGLDSFSNALVQLENLFPFSSASSSSGSPNSPMTFYFSIPQNDKLLGYWDIVEDRLFKIRHSLNITGVAQQLTLFAPPINPALLVQAVATGVDLNSALNDINPALPLYRFPYMLQKALELCADLKTLGAALLSALEKKDAEALATLRASQETGLLQAVRQIKVQQIVEAQDNAAALQKTLEMTQLRHDFYQNIAFMNDWETAHLLLVATGGALQLAQGVVEAIAGVGEAVPNVTVGVSGGFSSPVATVTYGGSNLGGAGQSAARILGIAAALSNTLGSMSATMGGYQRRWDEWQLQLKTLSKELEQVQKQIDAANIRATIAQIELDNQDKQIANASAIEAFLHSKYTNQELYDWMISQISSVFFQNYQMAYELAKRAERAYQFERGLTTSNYIKFGYWDSLRSGLLSGEQLFLDLKRLELAYLDQNAREYEISKQVSLALLNPLALISLKETGTCTVTLPELFFDIDYPGHYMRRIKSVALTIPCVAGPYTSINCTLTLQSSKIRINSNLQGSQQDPYVESSSGSDPRFVYNFGATGAIATSSAQNDSGMFEVNFRDERYLPFEGNGAISTWRIDLPADCNAFDFETISDVIIKLNYTARDGGSPLATAARQSRNAALAATPAVQQRLFSAKHEFFNGWYRFLHPAGAGTSQVLPLNLTAERFPFLFRGKTLTIRALQVFLKLSDAFAGSYAGAPGYKGNGLPLPITLAQAGSSTTFPATLTLNTVTGLPSAEVLQGKTASIGSWSLTVQSADIEKLDPSLRQTMTVNGQTCTYLNPDAFEDLWIVCQYSVQ